MASALCLASCINLPPLPPPPPPVVELAPSEGPILAVDVFRLPPGVAWNAVVTSCASGIRRAGDIAVTDRRAEFGALERECFRVAWLNELPLAWEGCACSTYRAVHIRGVAAARALVGMWEMPAEVYVSVLLEVGWHDEAATLAEREWLWCWEAQRTVGVDRLLRLPLEQLPRSHAVSFHDRLTSEAIEHARKATTERDSYQHFRAGRKLACLGEHLPAGTSAAAFVERVRDSHTLDGRHYAQLMRDLRPVLLAERSYAEALVGDSDPVGNFFNESLAASLVTGVASLVPSALIPAPESATSAQKWAIKEGAIRMLHEKRRVEGLVLYEALVANGRTKDAERLKRELKSRYPVKPIPTGDSEEDVALRKMIGNDPGHVQSIDFDQRFREAEERARAARGATRNTATSANEVVILAINRI